MTNSGQNIVFNAPVPCGTTPLLYLTAQVTEPQSVTFQAATLEASLSSASLTIGSAYTMYLYAGSAQVAVLALGQAIKKPTPQLKFSSPLQGVSISPGTPLVMEISPAAIASCAPNVFVTDEQGVQELLAPDYTTVNTLGSGFALPQGLAVDGSGNVFVSSELDADVLEIIAPGYTTVNQVANAAQIAGVAVDQSDNLDLVNGGQIEEFLAPNYSTELGLGSFFLDAAGIAVYNPTVIGNMKRHDRGLSMRR